MKQKFAVIRDDDKSALIVREYSELDKEEMTLLCEETYDLAALEATRSAGGLPALVKALRTRNFFPPSGYAARIAEAVVALIEDRSQSVAEVVVDDKEHLLHPRGDDADLDEMEEHLDEEVDEDSDVLDDLLDEDGDLSGSASLKVDQSESTASEDGP